MLRFPSVLTDHYSDRVTVGRRKPYQCCDYVRSRGPIPVRARAFQEEFEAIIDLTW
ncbi:MAG TPA: hypothetical protein VFZ97_19660 [Acidimicrobiales bacterium]